MHIKHKSGVKGRCTLSTIRRECFFVGSGPTGFHRMMQKILQAFSEFCFGHNCAWVKYNYSTNIANILWMVLGIFSVGCKKPQNKSILFICLLVCFPRFPKAAHAPNFRVKPSRSQQVVPTLAPFLPTYQHAPTVHRPVGISDTWVPWWAPRTWTCHKPVAPCGWHSGLMGRTCCRFGGRMVWGWHLSVGRRKKNNTGIHFLTNLPSVVKWHQHQL